jgi:hypothetical protein
MQLKRKCHLLWRQIIKILISQLNLVLCIITILTHKVWLEHLMIMVMVVDLIEWWINPQVCIKILFLSNRTALITLMLCQLLIEVVISKNHLWSTRKAKPFYNRIPMLISSLSLKKRVVVNSLLQVAIQLNQPRTLQRTRVCWWSRFTKLICSRSSSKLSKIIMLPRGVVLMGDPLVLISWVEVSLKRERKPRVPHLS